MDTDILSCSNENSFLYFAFGSNLLTKRIHLNNPSAQSVAIGKLKGYRLDFRNFSEKWKGAVATIVEDNESHVYGVLWRLSLCDMKHLDAQEGVSKGMYRPIEVSVDTGTAELIKARSYELVDKSLVTSSPSLAYKTVIVQGAKEHDLPKEYIEKLQDIKDNGYEGKVDINLSLQCHQNGN